MAQFSRIPFDSLSGVTGYRSDLHGTSTAASYAQLVHDQRVVFLKNKKTQIATPDNDLGAAICSYNEAMGEILVGLKDKLDQYSPEDLNILTPQKLILDEIDTVRCLIWKESRKLENSPAVKKAEEERKIRNLMSMRTITRRLIFFWQRLLYISYSRSNIVKAGKLSSLFAKAFSSSGHLRILELDERMRDLKSELQSFEGDENDEVHHGKAIKALKRMEGGNLFTFDHEQNGDTKQFPVDLPALIERFS